MIQMIRSRHKLRGKTAIVTGASSGIGKETALALAREGARLALAARREEALEDVAQAIRAAGGEAIVVPTDVTSREQVNNLVEQTLARWDRLDIVVANAGQYIRCPVPDLTVTEFERSFAVNFYGALYVMLAALPHMLAQKSGHVVLVSSLDGKKGLPLDAPYVAAKAALVGVGEVARQELRSKGIYVTTVLPGRVDTPLIGTLQVPGISAKIPPQAVARAIIRGIYRGKAEVVVPFSNHILIYVNALSPRLADRAVQWLHLEGWEQPAGNRN